MVQRVMHEQQTRLDLLQDVINDFQRRIPLMGGSEDADEKPLDEGDERVINVSSAAENFSLPTLRSQADQETRDQPSQDFLALGEEYFEQESIATSVATAGPEYIDDSPASAESDTPPKAKKKKGKTPGSGRRSKSSMRANRDPSLQVKNLTPSPHRVRLDQLIEEQRGVWANHPNATAATEVLNFFQELFSPARCQTIIKDIKECIDDGGGVGRQIDVYQANPQATHVQTLSHALDKVCRAQFLSTFAEVQKAVITISIGRVYNLVAREFDLAEAGDTVIPNVREIEQANATHKLCGSGADDLSKIIAYLTWRIHGVTPEDDYQWKSSRKSVNYSIRTGRVMYKVAEFWDIGLTVLVYSGFSKFFNGFRLTDYGGILSEIARKLSYAEDAREVVAYMGKYLLEDMLHGRRPKLRNLGASEDTLNKLSYLEVMELEDAPIAKVEEEDEDVAMT
ncbi:MAG: hypothetical protein Q9174_005944 [Haloplaca sp. 1 TL-2023]